MPGKGHVGTSLGGTESSPERRKRDAAKRKRQDDRWAKRSGPVVTRRLDDAEPHTEPSIDESSKDDA
jgi:hypothetical protein